MRARYPDQRGLRRARRRQDRLRGVTARRAHGRLRRRSTRSCTAGPGRRQIPYLARHARVVTIDPRGQRPLRPADRPGRVRDLQFVADTLAVMDAVGVDRAVLVAICSARWRSLLAAAATPSGCSGVVSLATWTPVPDPAAAARRGDLASTSELGHRRGLGQGQPALLAARLARLRRVLLRRAAARAALHQAVRGRASAGPPRPTPRSRSRRRGARPSITAARSPRRSCAGSTCPVLTIHGDDDRCQPHARRRTAAELTGGALRHPRGRRAPAAGPRPGAWSTALHPRLRRRGRPGARPPTRRADAHGRRPAQPRALYLSSPIGLGHARRDLAIAGALRKLRPGPARCDWLTQPPVDRVPGRARRAGAPGVARSWPASPRTSSRESRRARPARLPGGAANGRDPGQPTSWSSTTSSSASRYDLCRRRRGLGRRPLPAREPRAEARRRSPG